MAEHLKCVGDQATPPSAVFSKKTYTIAGILTTVYGLEELPLQASNVACVWLLHPRLACQERMSLIAAAILRGWNGRSRDERASSGQTKGDLGRR
ncbi:hypothetical protein EYZ11_011411 [Aspergillus tanneri]|uniref:Uncharacterized protein n=1 Tax=Aspergillus tanneri TaxID=1220188 RepID=A0A4V6RQN6_9EURO|nr:hypothetical protein EYZ11_011411 [Aspergillus tanneri]